VKSLLIAFVLATVATAAFAQGEYFVTLGPEARALSQRLQANAHSSPKRFDGSADVSKFPAWFLGSCNGDYHLIAYEPVEILGYVARGHLGPYGKARATRIPFMGL